MERAPGGNRLPILEHMNRCRRLGASFRMLSNQRPEVLISIPEGQDPSRRFRHPEEMAHLTITVTRNGQHRHSPDSLHPVEGHQKFGSVGELEQDSVVPLEPQFEQGQGEAVDPLPEPSIGQPVLRSMTAVRSASALRRSIQDIAKGEVLPPSLLRVLPDHLRWIRNRSLQIALHFLTHFCVTEEVGAPL